MHISHFLLYWKWIVIHIRITAIVCFAAFLHSALCFAAFTHSALPWTVLAGSRSKGPHFVLNAAKTDCRHLYLQDL